MKYTKGNWVLDTQTGHIRADGHLVAQVYGATVHNHEANAEECYTNARLILNAPRMLNALRKAIVPLSYSVYNDVLVDEIRELLDSVDGKDSGNG